MNRLSILKITLVILCLVATSSLNATTQDCTKTTDDNLIKSVSKKIYGKYKKQKQRINVHVENGEVTIEGWVVSETDIAKITEMVQKIKCVKKVTNNLVVGKTGGCGSGEKPCGEICIPMNQTCNIGKVR